MTAVANPTDEEPPAKRPRAEESVTAEQRARAEQNRLAALERRKQRTAAESVSSSQAKQVASPATAPAGAPAAAAAAAPAASGGLSQEQLERIQRNRQMALERKQRQQQEESAGPVPDSTQYTQEDTPASSSLPATQQPSQAGAGISDEPSFEAADAEQPASPSSPDLSELCSCSVSCSSSDSSSTSSSDEEGHEQSSSSSSSSSENPEDMAEEDAIAAEDDNEDEEQEDQGGAKSQDEQVDQEMNEGEGPLKESQAEEAAEGAEEELDLKNLPRVRGDVRPKNEPPCCTTRWPQLTLSPVVPRDVLAPRKKEDRKPKQALVAKLLCRWWYVLPDWPPKDFDYDAALATRGYRRVSVEAFEHEPELDEQGQKKAFAISGGYLGLFRDDQGNLVDVRPIEGRPSYDQLMLRSELELHKLVVAAYMRQLEDAESRPCTGAENLEHRKELRKELAEAKQRAVFAMTFMSKGGNAA